MTRLLLVRHGQSEWNALGKWQGQANPPLTDIGREQARQAGSVLGQFDAIFSSDLQRASETAVIISEILGIGPVVTDSDLQERCAVPWHGLTREENAEIWNDSFRLFCGKEYCTESKTINKYLGDYDLPNETLITGDMGSIIVADTSGLHRRHPVKTKRKTSRLVLQRPNPFTE